jgi:germination protein M
MKRVAKRRKWKWLWPAALLALPLAAGCTAAKVDTGSAPIDPPPSGVEEEMLAAADAPASNEDGLTVYLLDRNGYLAPMTLRQDGQADAKKTPFETAIAWMTAGSGLESQLPPGFTPVLPKGTKVSSIQADEKAGTVAIDFAAPLPPIPANQERKAVEALVWTMTEQPGIREVRLTVGGQPLQQMPASGLPLGASLSRAMGINLELAKGADITRSMAVTLYFSARSQDGESYFVPVTRLVNRQQDVAQAALEQLIQGPADTKALQPVLPAEMTVEKLSRLADTVDVSLRDDGWKSGTPVPAAMMQALVLTMTETTGVPQVRVAMNGDNALVDSNDETYDQPVTRPTGINALSQ